MKKLFAATLFGLLAGASLTANATVFTRYMNAGEILHKGDVLTSPNGRYRLVMQDDGNLVMYFFPGNQSKAYSRWSTSTNRNGGNYAAIQYDGNLAVYTGSNTWAWQAGTGGKATASYKLVLEDDGYLYLGSPTGTTPNVAFPYKDLARDTCSDPNIPATQYPAYIGQTGASFSVTAYCGVQADQLSANAGGQLEGFRYVRP